MIDDKVGTASQASAINNGGRIELLIITDQKDSSKHLTTELIPRTKQHFEGFIAKLPVGAKVLKNIGDSLMIRSALKPREIASLLKTILGVYHDLADAPVSGVRTPIRVLVMRLFEGEFVDGKDLGINLRNAKQDCGPPKKLGAKWLKGDVFGPNVALAFRASGIASDAIVVVQDEIANMVADGADTSGPFEITVDGTHLYFGPPLAFSPFKGLNDIYQFAGEGLRKDSWWPGHLYLRMADLCRENVEPKPNNCLIREQQKIRIFTQLAWEKKVEEPEAKKWCEELLKEEKNAGYIRSVARIDESFFFPVGGSPSPAYSYGIVVIGAYPSQESYTAIRASITKIKNQQPSTGFAYPVTTVVYVPGGKNEGEPESAAEPVTAFWTPGRKFTRYILLFARWTNNSRTRGADQARIILMESILEPLVLVRSGLIVGELWDVYAIMDIKQGSTVATYILKNILNKLFESMKTSGFDAVSFKVCVELL